MRSLPSILWMALAGCGAEGPQAAECEPELTWESYGEGAIAQWCGGCHSAALAEPLRNGAPSGVDFDTVDDVATHVSAIITVLEAGTEPPGEGMPADERDRMLSWLACDPTFARP